MNDNTKISVTIDTELWKLMISLTLKHFDGVVKHEWGVSPETDKWLALLEQAVNSAREQEK